MIFNEMSRYRWLDISSRGRGRRILDDYSDGEIPMARYIQQRDIRREILDNEIARHPWLVIAGRDIGRWILDI